MQQVILAIALLFSSLIFAQTLENKENLEGRTITVTVMNALNDTGTVNFVLFNEVGFRKQPVLEKSAVVEKGVSTIIFSNVVKGEYAIICYHDENKNNHMDFHENGIPKESYGTSNNAMLMGPPSFESSKFEVANEDLNLEIKF